MMSKAILIFILLSSVMVFAQDSLKTSPGEKGKISTDSLLIKSRDNTPAKNDSLIISDAIKPDSEIKMNPDSGRLTWHSWLTNIPDDYARFYDVAIHTSVPVYLSIAASTAALMATDNATWLGQHDWYKGF